MFDLKKKIQEFEKVGHKIQNPRAKLLIIGLYPFYEILK